MKPNWWHCWEQDLGLCGFSCAFGRMKETRKIHGKRGWDWVTGSLTRPRALPRVVNLPGCENWAFQRRVSPGAQRRGQGFMQRETLHEKWLGCPARNLWSDHPARFLLVTQLVYTTPPPLLLSITLRSVLSVHMWTLLMFSFPVEEEKASCFGKAWQEAEDGGDLQSPGLLQAERQQGRQHVPGEAAGVRGLDLAGLRHALRAFLREGTPLC